MLAVGTIADLFSGMESEDIAVRSLELPDVRHRRNSSNDSNRRV